MKNQTENLAAVFEFPDAAESDHANTRELGRIFALDPSAATDLGRAIFGGQQLDLESRAGVQQILDIMNAHGALEQRLQPDDPDAIYLRLNPGHLIGLLKQMPHRDPVTGLSRFSVQRG